MYQKIQDAKLKTGESVELGVVLGPATPELAASMRALLGHKGEIWKWQIEQSLTRADTKVESRFYILLKDRQPIANICSVEHNGIGIFGHVYTAPAERRKGAADIIHGHQIADFKKRGGRALYLGTGYDTHPFHLYEKHGFKGVEPRSGYMYWFADNQQSFERDVFAKAPVRVEPLSFEHWPTLPALAMMNHSARVRIAGMDVFSIRSTEGGSLPYLVAMHCPEKKDDGFRAFVAVSEKSQVPVAIACVRPDPIFELQTDILDMFCAPGFEDTLRPMVEKLALLPARTVICYSDGLWPVKPKLLADLGFTREAVLKQHYRSPSQSYDVELWKRV
ncbi:MAG TPA: GNAT family N-acetyltransferase [Planctomycetota bacterium]|jgi:hypothetical protein